MSTLPQIKWIVNNNLLSPLSGLPGTTDYGVLWVSKVGNIYLSNVVVNLLPTGTTNASGATVTATSPTNAMDVFFQKWTTDGVRVWSRAGPAFNNNGSDYATNIFSDDNGAVYVAGIYAG